MKPSGRLLRFAVVLAGILVLAVAAVPATASGGKAPGLVVERVSAERGTVVVTVVNIAPESRSGTVRVQVPLADRAIQYETRVALPEGQKVFLVFRLPGSKPVAIPFGAVLDDGIPF